ncbi:CHASE2 domain-containing protein [Aidingimonas lacisalsi]|uniref:CHASE2 domain-containing protein n=1 Tax=Aidingimonas lacisalsi TaxID=2604086 RepID=UPI0011D1E110|nr:adenylate/guanylate cyclase domain-containing protein [Aidingimonas lacisalsi]
MPKRPSPRLTVRAAGLALTLLAVLVQTGHVPGVSGLYQRLELLAYDLRLAGQVDDDSQVDERIAIVDIDESSLDREGQWPWPRQRLATLVERMRDAGAAVVAFDIMWPEPERNSVSQLAESLPEDEAASFEEEFADLAKRIDGDEALAEALEASESVLGFTLHDEANSSGQLPPPLKTDLADPTSLGIPERTSYTSNIPVLQEAGEHGGFFSLQPDRDGVIRRVPLVARHDGSVYPSLSLETLRLYTLADKVGLETERAGDQQVLEAIDVGGTRIATDAEGNMLVPFRGPRGSFPYVSAADVLDGREEALSTLEGAIVLVGTTAQGLFDLRNTPVGGVFPGVEIHANLLSAMLDERQLVSPDWGRGTEIATTLALGILLALLLPTLSPIWQGITVFLAVMGAVLGNLWAWYTVGIVLDLAGSLLVVVMVAALNLAYGFLFESRHKQRIKRMFGQYVPPALVDEMSANPDRYGFQGESRELSVLFSDIRGFTALSERLSANELKDLLNRFFTPMTRVIFETRGTVDKYVGDMVMAFWGAPLSDKHHAEQSIEAALAMLDEAARLRDTFRREGLPPIEIGVGINSGVMNVGDMGSDYRRAYTVLGDAVNLAARLEDVTRFYEVGIVIGERTRELAGESFIYRELDLLRVKGKSRAVRIYQPVCRREDLTTTERQAIDAYHQALQDFRAQRWSQADRCFARLQEQYEHDDQPPTKLYALYRERIAMLREQTLPADWDGVYVQRDK